DEMSRTLGNRGVCQNPNTVAGLFRTVVGYTASNGEKPDAPLVLFADFLFSAGRCSPSLLAGRDVHAAHRTHRLRQLHQVPSAESGGAILAVDVRRRTPPRAGHGNSDAIALHAAVEAGARVGRLSR